MTKSVAVIGGGIAGMEASSSLAAMGYNVTLFEKEDRLGGHLLKWKQLFPTRRAGKEVLSFLNSGIKNDKINVILKADIKSIVNSDKNFNITFGKNKTLDADALLLTTGYDLFDARKKEEYGYGIYDNVITSADLEELFTNGEEILTYSGKKPDRIALIHCVGSRDEKIGNLYCSKVCCATGVKQAIEIKEKLPDCEIFSFYMDLRMFDKQFEELYLEAQQKYAINFIRGRLSEACENSDGSLLIKAEDTLTGRPIKMNVDLLVLLVGFVPSEGSRKIGQMIPVEFDSEGFFKTGDEHTDTNISNIKGVFFAGTCKGPGTIVNTLTDARAAAFKVASYLEDYYLEKRGNGSH